MPRTPKPPGTQIASTPPSAFARPPAVWHSSRGDPADRDLGVVGEAAGAQRLGDRQVGVGQVDVLADQRDLDLVLGAVHPAQQLVPVGQSTSRKLQPQPADDVGVQALAVQHLGDVVDARRVDARLRTASASTSHISEILRLIAVGISRSARSTIPSGWMPTWRSAATECWVGLVFSSPLGREVGHQRDVQEEDVVAADVVADLAGGLEERQRLDVTDGAADLGDDDVGRLLALTPGAAAWARIRPLISLVMCGITCTVSPRYSPRRSLAMTWCRSGRSSRWPCRTRLLSRNRS